MSSKTPRGSRQLHWFLLEEIDVTSGVTARSWAAGPTKRGQNCVVLQMISEETDFEKGTSQWYPSSARGLSDGFAVR